MHIENRAKNDMKRSPDTKGRLLRSYIYIVAVRYNKMKNKDDQSFAGDISSI